MWIGIGLVVSVLVALVVASARQHAKDLRRDIRWAIHSAAFGDFAGARRRIVKAVNKLEGTDTQTLINVIGGLDDVERDIVYKLLGRRICESAHLCEYD